ncbi:serine/threonine-protein kinase [Sorangium sp. So ce204]|uniref:serine/threonine-protein kinase n=1 Tax=Sorangium sp. So ce204 TaxID=3133288 RepID=UPI003F5E53FA
MTSTAPTHDEAEGLVRPGQVIAEKYRVERVIGAGGMGVVVAATHLQLEERVAIKLLLPEAAKSRTLAERFVREARAAVKVKSEHVARVTDVGTLDSGTPYMVMEYLSGSDLADALRAGGPMTPQAAVEYVLQACEALAEAHAAGIIHRDLKPANLFLTRRADSSPCVKVLDFGISKVATGGSDPRITDTKAIMGSPLYMSPEQLKSSRDVDARTDIWSLGVILFELLTGAPPFDGATMPQLCVAIMQGIPSPLAAFRSDVPPALEAVIRKCLEKLPEQRYRHVGELAEALAPFATGRARLSVDRISGISRSSGPPRPELPSASGVTSPTVVNTSLSTSPTWSGTVVTRKRPVGLAVAAGAFVSLIAAVAAFAFLTSRSRGDGAATEAAASASAAPSPADAAAQPATAPASLSPTVTPGGAEAPAPVDDRTAAPGPAEIAPAPPAAPASGKPAAPRRPSAAPRPPAPTHATQQAPATRPPAAPAAAPSGGNLFDDRK